jgi:hypothetical protein
VSILKTWPMLTLVALDQARADQLRRDLISLDSIGAPLQLRALAVAAASKTSLPICLAAALKKKNHQDLSRKKAPTLKCPCH